MNILYLLIPLSLMLLSLAVWAFFWAVKHDQFEDLEGPAWRILFDDDDTCRRQSDEHSSSDLLEPPSSSKRRDQP
ncbi:cbb3-type cytochrome oxidase assembly protein CcoS [Halomonas huangheensis]|uniref:Cytochrome oxidase maturation protein Cbb3 n=1 Tax=Halomonas huangheensis TaxID=1178482 RepID=W1N3F4_9GAMM|nr:cbb3-type cytochrome oxidase assembly protein CcoS [Halomonas huangheensis]ALM51573.1 hypothetical protein AR456_04165 [Halomonas huangheensis]ERL50053.1 hypothetical protein BJB45_02680 [Halomonas huangheensis]